MKLDIKKSEYCSKKIVVPKCSILFKNDKQNKNKINKTKKKLTHENLDFDGFEVCYEPIIFNMNFMGFDDSIIEVGQSAE